MSDPQNHLNILVTQGQRQVVISSSLTITVEPSEEMPTMHISDFVGATVLKKLKEQEGATLSAGKYQLMMTVAVSDLPMEDEDGSTEDQ